MEGIVHRAFAILSVMVVLGAANACASAGAGAASPATKTSPNLITAAEIDAGDFRSAYDVVQRLRPNWFTKAAGGSQAIGGGSGLLVYLDNTRMGGVEALRDLTPGGIQSLEYMDASTAQSKLPGIGSSVISGAIRARSRVGH
jgi:hypothetical protein